MPFRFRKSISLGKGFRLNLSKGGISSTFGIKGLHLNVGKRGVRPTVGVPGTGLSFTPSNSQSASKTSGSTKIISNAVVAIISIVVICIVALCCIGLFLYNPNGTNATATPTTTSDISAIIQQTANAAQVQTQAASSPTPYITSTFLPTLTQPATLAVIDTLVPPSTVLPFDQPTATIVYILPTNPPPSGGAVCSCSGDSLNCKDFSSQSSAQACFNYCVSQGRGDIHNLDGDANGLACESL